MLLPSVPALTKSKAPLPECQYEHPMALPFAEVKGENERWKARFYGHFSSFVIWNRDAILKDWRD